VAEVAEIMDASLVATKTRVWRARQHLQGCARRDPSLAVFLSNDVDDRSTTEGES
jgi:DNA-directed RNA polymerase specialized sigma24 family protein